jgi:hypothetical protein
MFAYQRINIYWFTLIFLLPMFVTAQRPPHMGAVIEFSHARFDPELHFTAGGGFGGGLFYAISSTLRVEAEGHQNNSRREFDQIGGRDELAIILSSFLLKLQVSALYLPGDINFSLSGGIGVLRLERKAHTISLGALGQHFLPAESETHTLYSLGVNFSRNLSSRFFMRFEPQAQFFSVSGIKTNFYIKGGLGIVFF